MSEVKSDSENETEDELKVGDGIEIYGRSDHWKIHNGKRGQIVRQDHDGKYLIKVEQNEHLFRCSGKYLRALKDVIYLFIYFFFLFCF